MVSVSDRAWAWPAVRYTPSVRWVVWLAEGAPTDITGPVVIGRSPSPEVVPGVEPDRVLLLTVSDPGRFLSRSHLVVEPAAETLRLRNASTRNPVKVVGIDGGVALVAAGQAYEVRGTARAVIGEVLIDLIAV